ncbi:MAG: 6-phosphogluconolactonase [Gallionellales bacterium GWA2_59_43]|nr:MAG: 6-phosphogluconolactonase [Gallionellales bacterium GWA2_59_43]
MKRLVFDDIDSLSIAAARRVAELGTDAIAARGVFRIALAGGETPRRCYEQLRQLPLDWSRVQIYFGDERCLPIGDAQRNDTMARETLLDRVAIPAMNLHDIPAELGAEAAAASYAATLGCEPLDLALLGMGEDGHTASLFPGNPATTSHDAVVAVFGAPKPPPERVSLGIDTLNAARHKLFLVAGAGKRAALARMEQGEPLPAAAVADAEWYLDRAATQ